MCKIKIINEISAEPMFKDCAKVFSGYAKEKNVEFKCGNNGLILKENSSLQREEWKATINGGTVEFFASSQKGMHNALAKVLEGLEVREDGVYADFSITSEVPDMPYRGLSVDLARQKHSADFIIKYIDLCYKCRATHLQLHFSDNESFTLPMKAYPKLSTEGRTYTYEEIENIRTYAKVRGIELVPEVDVPGHTREFCQKYPELFGTLDVLPASEDVFEAVRTIFKEVAEMFPESPWIHIGGDEAAINKWAECEKTQKYMKENNIKDIHEMYGEYIALLLR